ncbi:acetylcholine receptor subunit gamma-like [Sinocyclocheilus rhinocerous]|uniref:acetylcholine receptor subunit gamma-like n=1 Tax=Sinocyclocheilus rhinocerous TaxID=307959 RepID=UPI0007B80332|nr:PREDICTED: acetylcholine receptor subunit gamma-like [Sinocyclocheilus rhinocerous]
MDLISSAKTIWLWTLLSLSFSDVICNLEGSLHRDLMVGYNKNIRHMENHGDITDVKIKMTLTNLISLNEKEETLSTCVWIEMKWHDYRLRWANRTGFEVFENITRMRLPSKAIWLPDIGLENNVDGRFEVALYTNALIDPDGSVVWLPPAIYQSSCAIKVNYFPFDWQNCSMVFRSETYNANEIELMLSDEDNVTMEWIEIDPEAFTENGEWIIKHRPAKKVVNKRYSPDELEYQEIIFFLIIQRKPLFYIINIIVPCVLFSSLGLLVYFLPAKAGGQKCTMTIAILLGQTVFLFLIAKKVPEKNGLGGNTAQDLESSLASASPEVQQCVSSCKHIAESAKHQNDFQSENEEWFLVARVIDRMCFIVMALLFILGTIGIFLMGHFNQAPSQPFPGDPQKYLPEISPGDITG